MSSCLNVEVPNLSGIEEKIRALPPELQQEVEDFVLSLMARRVPKGEDSPTLAWAGALKGRCGNAGAVELQHTISQWRVSGQ